MIFTAPLGLLALLAIPAIIAIHLFRRKFPPRPVAGLFLWQIVRQTPEGGGKISKLPITASLLLECLAALALALILAGARIAPAAVSEHLVVLLDDSASMAAVNAQGESPRDRAVRRILDELEGLGRDARFTLVQSGERPAVMAGPAALAVEAEPALERWRPEAAHHSLSLGLRLARELAGETGRLLLVSDSPGEAEGALWASFGEPVANAGITGAQRTLSPEEGRGTVSLTLGNFSGAPMRRELRIAAHDKDVLVRNVEIPAGASSLNLPIPTGLPAVRVSLSDDALKRDNEVLLVEPRPRVVGVGNSLPDGRGREALSRALAAISGVTLSDQAQLAFVPSNELEAPAQPGRWRVGFGEPPATLASAGEPDDYIGPFVPEKRHALVQGVTLGGVVWTGAAPLNATAVHPLVSAGDRPLIGVLDGRPENGILFNIDLERTNLIRAPDWPILISNLVELRRRSLPGPERWNYRAGEWIRVRLDRDPEEPVGFRCGAIERTLPPGRLLEFAAPESCGLLHILQGENLLFELAVNFLDEKETNLAGKSSGETGAADAQAAGLRAESGPESDPLFWALVVVAGAALMANWCWLGPARSGA